MNLDKAGFLLNVQEQPWGRVLVNDPKSEQLLP